MKNILLRSIMLCAITIEYSVQAMGDEEIKFTSKNMYFKVGKSTRYNAVDMYLLTPMETEVSNRLKELGIKMVALAKTFSGDAVTNEITIYFYYKVSYKKNSSIPFSILLSRTWKK